MRTVWLVIACASALAGCNSSTPTTPTPVTPPVTVSPLPPSDQIATISVIGGQWVALGGAPLQMTARIYTRTSPPIEYVDDVEHVAWSVEPANVLSVDKQGRLTALASGIARVTATARDRSGFADVRAVPEFTGAWTGDYIVTGCSGAPDFRTCPRLMLGEGLTRIKYPFSLSLSQTQAQVSGTLRETSPTFNRETPVSGFVRVSGELVLEATVPQPDLEPFRIMNWSMTINASGTQIAGAFTRIAPSRSTIGAGLYTLRTEHEFSSVTRTP